MLLLGIPVLADEEDDEVDVAGGDVDRFLRIPAEDGICIGERRPLFIGDVRPSCGEYFGECRRGELVLFDDRIGELLRIVFKRLFEEEGIGELDLPPGARRRFGGIVRTFLSFSFLLFSLKDFLFCNFPFFHFSELSNCSIAP